MLRQNSSDRTCSQFFIDQCACSIFVERSTYPKVSLSRGGLLRSCVFGTVVGWICVGSLLHVVVRFLLAIKDDFELCEVRLGLKFP